MRLSSLWSSLGALGLGVAQLPVRYVLKADVWSFLWHEQRLMGEYRLGRWAPPFIASVERPRWEGLAATVQLSFYRRLPWWGLIARPGVRYYFLNPKRALEGMWSGIHVGGGFWTNRQEQREFPLTSGIAVGYQHIFRQAYGLAIEPYFWVEVPLRGNLQFLQVGFQVGFASRRWSRRNLQ
ncbi:MAG: hypothetical protein RMK19_06615 [Bacteroidia bacterium]|nr:hypothetical protein [Bacteroidia bacterium]MDW8015667.1 hypothetical protein [Bacteroidia bacterium]